jgi:hypothetical protein
VEHTLQVETKDGGTVAQRPSLHDIGDSESLGDHVGAMETEAERMR